MGEKRPAVKEKEGGSHQIPKTEVEGKKSNSRSILLLLQGKKKRRSLEKKGEG